jgi:hypothetical protein
MEPACTREEFLRTVKAHEMTVVRDDGLYRHLRFARAETCIESFDIITWPGHLCYSGDLGTFVFARLRDMFQFFRGDRINPGYWAEKLVATDRHRGHEEYDPERFRERIAEWRKDWIKDGRANGDLSKEQARELFLAVDDQVLCSADDGEVRARDAAADFEHVAGWRTYRLDDFWEVNLQSYTYRFLFCCYALPWAIAKYDEAQGGKDGG